MRVLIDYRPALRSPSGVGAYVRELAGALARRPGLQVAAFSSSWKDRLRGEELERRGIEAIDRRVPVRVLNLAWHRLGFPPVEWLGGGGADVVHSPSPLLVPARDAARIVTLNDLHFLTHPEHVTAEIRRDYPALAKAHVARADGVIAISRYTAREAERLLDLPAERVTVCYPGVPAWVAAVRRDGYAPGSPAARTGGSPAASSHVLFVGTLEPRKNIGRVLEAYGRVLARLPAAPGLVLAGRATEAAAPWLEALERPPFAGHVRHTGYVSETDLAELYDRAALLVLPSHDEGFGIPALEALAMGVPAVVANRGALPEVVGHAGLLVDPDDEEALAEAMCRVLTDRGLAADLVRRGLEQARRFDWDATAAAALGAYERAIARKASGRRADDRRVDRVEDVD